MIKAVIKSLRTALSNDMGMNYPPRSAPVY